MKRIGQYGLRRKYSFSEQQHYYESDSQKRPYGTVLRTVNRQMRICIKSRYIPYLHAFFT